MRKMKKRLFFDMDNVLVDFQSGLDKIDEETKNLYRSKELGGKDRLDEIPGLFGKMDPMPGAIEAVHKLIITHRKDLVEGDYLIDDRGKNGTSEFKGEWIEFGSERFPDWNTVVTYLLTENRRA